MESWNLFVGPGLERCEFKDLSSFSAQLWEVSTWRPCEKVSRVFSAPSSVSAELWVVLRVKVLKTFHADYLIKIVTFFTVSISHRLSPFILIFYLISPSLYYSSLLSLSLSLSLYLCLCLSLSASLSQTLFYFYVFFSITWQLESYLYLFARTQAENHTPTQLQRHTRMPYIAHDLSQKKYKKSSTRTHIYIAEKYIYNTDHSRISTHAHKHLSI